MKKIKIIVLSLCLCSLGFFAWSEEDETDKIFLPQVTTEVTTKDMVASAEDLPDFSEVITAQKGSGSIVPQLPDMDAEDKSEKVVKVQQHSENSIFAEGKIGGGYPLGIYGDFTVYRLTEESPFQFSFLHDSAAGYSRNSLGEGYSDSKTKVAIDKTFTFTPKNFRKTSIIVDLDYQNDRNGLQGKEAAYSDVYQNNLFTSGAVNWDLGKGFVLGAKASGDFYNRYLNSTNSDYSTIWNMDLSPEVSVNWKNYGFNVGFVSLYNFAGEEDYVHRFSNQINFSWQNHFIKPFASVAVVLGNQLNDNYVVVPFKAGVDFNFSVPFASQQVMLKVEGGMDSYRSSISALEEKYKFTELNFTANETSDWYGKLEVSIPVFQQLTTTARAEYRLTALDNGYVQACYEKSAYSKGLYGYEVENRSILITDLSAVYNYKLFSFGVQWYTNWMYVPVLEDATRINLSAAFQNEQAKWNGTVTAGLGFGDDGMSIPLIGFNGYVKLAENVNMILSLEDIFNLIGGKARTYGGQYISRSGSATVMIKFFF